MKLNQKTRTTIAYTMMGLLGILQISVLLIIAGLAYTLTSLVVVFVDEIIDLDSLKEKNV